MSVLACDIGGTRIKAGIVGSGPDADVLAFTSIPAEAEAGLAAALPRISAAWASQCDELAGVRSDLRGIGMGFPSLVDNHAGRILMHSEKFTDAPGLDLTAWARESWGLPFVLDNDARAACVGEWRYGAGKGCDNLVMLTLGTGIGSAVIINGRVLRGPHFSAGGYGGHLTVAYHGALCHCGNIGCAEAMASTFFLAARARERTDFDQSSLAALDVIDYKAIFEHAERGDACACALRDAALGVWSALVVTHIHAFDPERVVLGGGIMGSADTIVPAVSAYVDEHATMIGGRVEIVAGEYPRRAALLGCSWLVDEAIDRDARGRQP